ncbi:hypothetical protein [Vibrio sp. C8]
MTYDEVFKDWCYLFDNVGVADDMTGGYVDSEDLDELLRKPTKGTAKWCLSRQIDYWFAKGIQYSNEHKGKSIFDLIEEYPLIEEIADRNCADLELCPNPFVQSPN